MVGKVDTAAVVLAALAMALVHPAHPGVAAASPAGPPVPDPDTRTAIIQALLSRDRLLSGVYFQVPRELYFDVQYANWPRR